MNKPNILSNESDQVTKTGKRYQEELNKQELQEQIVDAFFYFSEDRQMLKDGILDDEFFVRKAEKSVSNRLFDNKEHLPISEVLHILKDHPTVSCEISRRKKEKTA